MWIRHQVNINIHTSSLFNPTAQLTNSNKRIGFSNRWYKITWLLQSNRWRRPLTIKTAARVSCMWSDNKFANIYTASMYLSCCLCMFYLVVWWGRLRLVFVCPFEVSTSRTCVSVFSDRNRVSRLDVYFEIARCVSHMLKTHSLWMGLCGEISKWNVFVC